MFPIDNILPGETTFFFQGGGGQLEAILTYPEETVGPFVAILGHPHSLQGGTMNNKVVTTLARAFKELGIPSLRFNFRGVGASAGAYDAGMGESEDMLILRALWSTQYPNARFLFAGFSFGSYVAYRAAALSAHDLLLTIAPPVHHYDYAEWSSPPKPWVVFQGDEDEVVPLTEVLTFTDGAQLPVVRFPHTGHFFHGQLLPLRTEVMDCVREQVLGE